MLRTDIFSGKSSAFLSASPTQTRFWSLVYMAQGLQLSTGFTISIDNIVSYRATVYEHGNIVAVGTI